MNPLLQLMTCGQSYWLDELTHDMMRNGALEQRIAAQGPRGVTSNPTTFPKAILGSQVYNGLIAQRVEVRHDGAAP